MSQANRTIRGYLKRMLQLFLQGLIVLAPIGITIWVVYGLFTFVDGLLPGILDAVVPGNRTHIPGLGFVVVIALVLFVGWISSLFFVERIVALLDTVLEKTPGIKFIYSSVKDFLEAFAGNKKKFDKPVLVNIDAANVWRIGFITQPNAHEFGLPEHVTVYVPHSYAISGITYLVPRERIKLIENLGAADAMKYTVSGGVTDVHEQTSV